MNGVVCKQPLSLPKILTHFCWSLYSAKHKQPSVLSNRLLKRTSSTSNSLTPHTCFCELCIYMHYWTCFYAGGTTSVNPTLIRSTTLFLRCCTPHIVLFVGCAVKMIVLVLVLHLLGVTGWHNWLSVGLEIQRTEVRIASGAQERFVSFSESKMLC